MFEKSFDHGVSVKEEGRVFLCRGRILGVRRKGVTAKSGKSKKNEKGWLEGHNKEKRKGWSVTPRIGSLSIPSMIERMDNPILPSIAKKFCWIASNECGVFELVACQNEGSCYRKGKDWIHFAID
jgi:hypothetical protein